MWSLWTDNIEKYLELFPLNQNFSADKSKSKIEYRHDLEHQHRGLLVGCFPIIPGYTVSLEWAYCRYLDWSLTTYFSLAIIYMLCLMMFSKKIRYYVHSILHVQDRVQHYLAHARYRRNVPLSGNAQILDSKWVCSSSVTVTRHIVTLSKLRNPKRTLYRRTVRSRTQQRMASSDFHSCCWRIRNELSQ